MLFCRILLKGQDSSLSSKDTIPTPTQLIGEDRTGPIIPSWEVREHESEGHH